MLDLQHGDQGNPGDTDSDRRIQDTAVVPLREHAGRQGRAAEVNLGMAAIDR